MLLQGLLLLPVVGGTVYSLACLVTMARLRKRTRCLGGRDFRPAAGTATPSFSAWPAVSLLKPVYGMGKDLEINLSSACCLDYPDYQVVFSAQREDEPALPLLYALQREYGAERVTVCVDGTGMVPNGKVRNMLVGYAGARHDLIVVSDADVPLRPDYLKAIVAPFADPTVGCTTTFYKAAGARHWYEALEQLFFNSDWVPNLVFAYVTGASPFVLGASNAVRRSTLETIGGLEELGYYLLEDFEMGRRVRELGQRIAVVPYFVETLVDLRGFGDWWRHQLYWDKNTRAGNPWGFFGTIFIRTIPFALAFAAARLFDPVGLGVLAVAVAGRLVAAGLLMAAGLGDRVGLRYLYLVPLRDCAGLLSTVAAFVSPTVRWAGARFVVGRGGRMIAQELPD